MTRADEDRVRDILDAAAQLAEIVSLGHDRFHAESLLQRATERLLEIIGEAANAMTDGSRAAIDGVPWEPCPEPGSATGPSTAARHRYQAGRGMPSCSQNASKCSRARRSRAT